MQLLFNNSNSLIKFSTITVPKLNPIKLIYRYPNKSNNKWAKHLPTILASSNAIKKEFFSLFKFLINGIKNGRE